jgi:hypothetical protein
MGTVRGYRRGTSLLWVRRSTAERPSPPRVCSDLSYNALTGSVPSSLSALTKLQGLCVPPLSLGVCACAAVEGRIGRLCSECAACERAACREMHVGGIERGRCGSRAVAGLSEGTLAHDVTEEYSRGTPSYGVRCAGTFRGTWLQWVRRSTAVRPSPLRVCSDLSFNTLTGSVPSSLSALTELTLLCVFPSSHGVCACGRAGSDGSALLRAARHVGGCMSGASSMGGTAAGLLRDSQRGPRLRDVTKEYSRGTPFHGYGARGPSGAHGCSGCGVAPPSGRVRCGCAETSATMS